MDKNLIKLNKINDYQYGNYVERCHQGFTALERIIKSGSRDFNVTEMNEIIRKSSINGVADDELGIDNEPILVVLIKSKKIKLTEEWDIDYLIDNTDFTRYDSYKQMDVMSVFLSRGSPNINILTEERLLKIIKKSDMEYVDDDGWNVLTYLARFGGELPFTISDKFYKYVIELSDVAVAIEALSYNNDEHGRGDFLHAMVERFKLETDLDGIKDVKKQLSKKL